MGKLLRSRRFQIAVVLGTATLVIGALPFLFLILPNPVPVRVPGLDGEIIGTYIARDDGIYKLYPYTAPASEFPAEALTVSDRPWITIKFRQPGSLGVYGIWSWSDNQPVPVRKNLFGEQRLELIPENALNPGDYYVAAARDGIYGGEDYFYFRVK
ncbi:MAG: hypothetical protein ACYC6B_08675 [Thermoleophilia bacterium]